MNKQIRSYSKLIKNYIQDSYKKTFREPVSWLKFSYLVPGANYSHSLWDWDSWLVGEALLELEDEEVINYEKGCILNFIDHIDKEGKMPILIQDDNKVLKDFCDNYVGNIHKPCLAQHALAISKKIKDYSWIKPVFNKMLSYLKFYDEHQYHKESGLYFWIDDTAIGFDNDPTVFYRPNNSTAAIYLNSLMYNELLAVKEIANKLSLSSIASKFDKKASLLKKAIQEECFDNVSGYFYSVDISLRPVDKNMHLHSGHPRFWKSLPIKITTWAGMMPLWNKVATKKQAERAVNHFLNSGLNSNYGIRSVSKNEKMYCVKDTSNPSCWLGPVWIVANYMTYVGLKNYGYDDLANDIAVKTITLLGKDLEKSKEFHEYYDGDSGKGVRGPGFQSWNFLVLKMIKDLE